MQEFDGVDEFPAAWLTVCMLKDAEFVVNNWPVRWARASNKLRDMMERG